MSELENALHAKMGVVVSAVGSGQQTMTFGDWQEGPAAEKLWAQLGEPTTAAQRVQQVLQEISDPTVVESRKVRPEFTAFGQTIGSLADQVRPVHRERGLQ